MGADLVLVMIAKGYVKEDAGEEDDHDGAGGGAGEELKMEMFLAKKPAGDAA
jgi:hypothetical protein